MDHEHDAEELNARFNELFRDTRELIKQTEDPRTIERVKGHIGNLNKLADDRRREVYRSRPRKR